ncbi:MAG: TIGR03757 family integrating conjugative element protein [Geminicoccaceae bacterium]
MSPAARSFLLMLGGALMSPVTFAADEARDPDSVEVFTTSDHQIGSTNIDVTIFEIDGLAVLDRELSQSLPADPEEAKRIALRRISELGDDLRSRAERAAEGLNRAHRYGIKKVPAVVFDGGQSVVYGLVDLNQAIGIYRRGAKP